MFLSNKYSNIYFKIIEQAKITHRTLEYKETHHIIPKSLGGSDDASNLVDLTPREHYICHALLPKMVESPRHIRAMYAAFNMMHCNHNGQRYTSKLYEYYKTNFYKIHSEMMKGRVRSPESRAKQSRSTKGKPWTEKARAAKRIKPTAKPVNVYNAKTGEHIATYESVSLAAKSLGADATNIWKMCEGKQSTPAPNGKTYQIKSHKGYVFRYVENA